MKNNFLKEILKNILSKRKKLWKKIERKYFPTQFKDSETYWTKRYKAGGNSGPGSYSQLSEFKAEIINNFVEKNNIESVIEFGSGDGNQLSLAKYKKYVGFDVSPEAVSNCKKGFQEDSTKTFKLVKDYNNEKADLSLSLDVIYHLVENSVFEKYMKDLFLASSKYVVIYSSNNENIYNPFEHIKHRNFTKWIEENIDNWHLKEYIPNKYPFNGIAKISSFADFYIYEKSTE